MAGAGSDLLATRGHAQLGWEAPEGQKPGSTQSSRPRRGAFRPPLRTLLWQMLERPRGSLPLRGLLGGMGGGSTPWEAPCVFHSFWGPVSGLGKALETLCA